MYVYVQTPVEDYLKYYANQAGFGQVPYGIQAYKGSSFQRGNGLGSIFQSLWRVISPMFGSDVVRGALKSAGTSALNVGADMLKGQDFKQAVQQRARETGANIMESAVKKLRGEGRKRRKRRSVAPARKKPRRKQKKKKKQRGGGKTKKKRKTKKKKSTTGSKKLKAKRLASLAKARRVKKQRQREQAFMF